MSDIAVYFDKLYSTFLFAPAVPSSLKATGILRDALGQPLAHHDLSLTSNGVTYKTVTRSDGTYRFYGAPVGAATVATMGATWPMMIGAAPITQDLAIPAPPACDINACHASCSAELAACRHECGANGACLQTCNAESVACRNACCQ